MVKINNISNNNSYCAPNFRGLNIGPTAAKVLDKVGSMQSPSQRLIFGVSALALQPAIDLMNPWVDKDTRETSAVRSVAKAIVSTATGVVIREACILGTNAILNGKKLASRLPEFITKDKAHSAGVIGTLMGLGIMVFTNFLLDAPYTNKMTNFLMKKYKDSKEAKQTNRNGQQKPATPAPNIQKEQMPKINIQTNISTQNINYPDGIAKLSQVNREVLKCHQ